MVIAQTLALIVMKDYTVTMANVLHAAAYATIHVVVSEQPAMAQTQTAIVMEMQHSHVAVTAAVMEVKEKVVVTAKLIAVYAKQ